MLEELKSEQIIVVPESSPYLSSKSGIAGRLLFGFVHTA